MVKKIMNLSSQSTLELTKHGESMKDLSEIDLVREGYALDIFTIFGNDPYTIPLIMLTHSWMKTALLEERNNTHLWGYASKAYANLNNDWTLNDHTYRDRMDRLRKRDVVYSIQFVCGGRPKYDYALTEYGEAVYKKLRASLLEQIRLEKWFRRSRKK